VEQQRREWGGVALLGLGWVGGGVCGGGGGGGGVRGGGGHLAGWGGEGWGVKGWEGGSSSSITNSPAATRDLGSYHLDHPLASAQATAAQCVCQGGGGAGLCSCRLSTPTKRPCYGMMCYGMMTRALPKAVSISRAYTDAVQVTVSANAPTNSHNRPWPAKAAPSLPCLTE
jgi:hypothetical protein